MNKTKIWLKEIRAPFFTATIIPIVLGAAIAFNTNNSFNWFYFILTLIGGVCLHAGSNVINDYFDHLSKNDELNEEFVSPFTGGSRMIQNGMLTPKEVLVGAIIFFAAGSIIGLFLAFKIGWPIVFIGLFGVLSGVLYVAPKINLVGKGIGEVLIGINFGILMTFGSFYVQTSTFSWIPVIASIPVSLLIAAVLFINEFQDAKADAAVGKNHLVVRFGKQKAVNGYVIIMLATYLSIIVSIITDAIPPIALIALLTVPIAFKSIKIAQQHYDNSSKLAPANASTIMNHLFTGILLVLSFFIDRFIS